MAAELVGGALLSAFLQVAFDRLASREIHDFFRKRRLNEALLNKLNIMLLSMNAVVDDAEQKQISNPNVKSWLDRVKDAVYEAEDVLDEIDYELSKRKVEAEFQTSATSKVRSCCFSVSFSSFDKKIESRMKIVLENLEYLASQKDVLKLKDCGDSGSAGFRSRVSERLPTTSLVDETGIYGRDYDKEIIIDWLLSDNDSSNRLSVISIVGMGGLGKSTLAQLVYNDRRVKDEFNLKTWVCVSEDFDPIRVTRAIVEAISLSNDDTRDINVLQIKLKEMLIGKRFLLVLDDVWNENYIQWEFLQTPLNYGASGSKILVTTRSNTVATTMCSARIHPLKQLTEEDSWLLFRRYAFCNGDSTHSNSQWEEISRRIILKCKGLPLALQAIGSLFRTRLSLEESNSLLISEIWEEESNVLPALRLSYHYLPSLLKRCFAYCSLFPKDYEFDEEDLVELWMAEGFLWCAQHNKSIREAGHQFFQDLVSRSFFQRSSEDKMRYVMHDLVNDLAKHVAGRLFFNSERDEVQTIPKTTRHFSFLGNNKDYIQSRVISKDSGLRTFLPLSMNHVVTYRSMSSKMIHDLLHELRCLRVLSLSGYSDIIKLPNTIGDLKHLRYLDLSRTGLKRLPDSVCLLYNLQTLKLRYCTSLEKLPSDLHKLINLCHLDFRETKVREMPKGLGNLKNLQVLTSFFVSKFCEPNIKQLGELNLGGVLSISELQNVVYPLDALRANLKNKMFLEELILEWSMESDESTNGREVLENLQPHQNLKKLVVRYYGGTRFPYWFGDNTLFSIQSLELSNCKYCAFLPSLGLLPSLKSLTITGFDGIVAIGPEFYGDNFHTVPFGSLEILKFQELTEWEKWECITVSRAFPCLKELYIINCPKLKEDLPTQLPSLTKLFIDNCQQLVASIPLASAIHELVLKKCGRVQLEYLASTLKLFQISGPIMEVNLLERIEHNIGHNSLEELQIDDCPNLDFPLHHCHSSLLKLVIKSGCSSLITFPLDLFPNLRSLELIGCSNLEMLVVSEGHHHDFTCLTELKIFKCPKFVSFPKTVFSASRLELCDIGCLESLKSLPENMHILFPSLRHLVINDCPQLESFPEGGLPPNLKNLDIFKCQKLVACRMEWNLHSHSSLNDFAIEDADVESLPDPGLLPPTLTRLQLQRCTNLRTLDHRGLCHLSSLRTLFLANCPNLQSLPEENLPSSLWILQIRGCPLLRDRYQNRRNCRKIVHIPFVRIDQHVIVFDKKIYV